MADKRLNVMVMGGHTEGFHVFSIMGPIYKKFLTDAGVNVTLTEDRDDFLAERIKGFDVVVCYTTGENLTPEQAQGLMGGIIQGKGFVGVHSAADSFKETPGYLNMVGGKFLTHPSYWPELVLNIKNRHHPVVHGLEDFQMADELYLMETYGHFEVIMSTWFKGFERPITWVKPYGHGRIVYTALGHDKQQTENENFQKLVINAVRWVGFPDE
ncbi:MAG: ThuA domain-containing protein [Candidatus Hydrogenedentes bacterium]|nr:ThuA domain-containing protein [Candidatus Hydrogenedentota bacterium]